MTTEEWNEYFSGHWHFSGAKQDQHLAMFPEELPKRLIKMFSFAGETVLDPFLGSGTTALAAKNLNRNSVGYEINPNFIPIIRQKLGADTQEIFEKPQFEFLVQKTFEADFEQKIRELPYVFVDTHKLDKKIDVKKLQFGSKIDENSPTEREELFSVKEVISPELVRLNNDLIIRLIGVKKDESKNGSATEFLKEKTKGQKVFLRFDDTKYDSENRLFAYLYLQNKTFLNAHLIKKGFALVDESVNFRYKSKFLNLLNQ
jgi:site-specific DNA-methyltransferase (adenine-specific)